MMRDYEGLERKRKDEEEDWGSESERAGARGKERMIKLCVRVYTHLCIYVGSYTSFL